MYIPRYYIVGCQIHTRYTSRQHEKRFRLLSTVHNGKKRDVDELPEFDFVVL